MQSRLERSVPEREGVSSAGLLEVLREFSSEEQFNSVMIMRHGRVICEGWWAPYRQDEPHQLFSLSKSFTSTAVGMCVAEGRLSVQDRVTEYFRDVMPRELTPWLEKMTVKNLLTMASGHAECIAARLIDSGEKDWPRAFFANPLKTEPGSTFVYNSMATYMLSVLVTRLTGQKVVDYLMPRLFEPLGIPKPEWDECPQGYNTGGWGLHLRTEDIAKFGQLYLQKGVWEGKRLISEAWLEEATTVQIDNSPKGVLDWAAGYGYQFWKCQPEGVYRGDGAYGQYCIVMPKQDMVVAATEGTGNMQKPLTTMWEKLLPLCQDEALPDDAVAQEELWAYLNNLRVKGPQGALSDAVRESRDYQLLAADNDCGFQSFALSFDEAGCVLRVQCADGTQKAMTYGRFDWRYSQDNWDVPHDWPHSAGMMRWQADGTLMLMSYGVGGPFRVDAVLTFGGTDGALSALKLRKQFHFWGSHGWKEFVSR